jgi:L-alanine-DL-glutamate epimerase-like enolase superfamily enzyme
LPLTLTAVQCSTPFVGADVYRDVTINTSTPIHTGEQIYLRENFKELIETKAVNVLGPDPLDVGGTHSIVCTHAGV